MLEKGEKTRQKTLVTLNYVGHNHLVLLPIRRLHAMKRFEKMLRLTRRTKNELNDKKNKTKDV